MTDPELPVFMSEVRYYRLALSISWVLGAHLRRLGALIPDAVLDDGRVLFQLTPEKLEAARKEVFLHKASTNQDADRTSFGFITNPTGRKTLERTTKFAGGAVSIWDSVKNECEISRQVSDGRVFAGLWAYLAIATWGAGEEGTYSVDLTVDHYTLSTTGRVAITAAVFADVAVRWRALFSFTDQNVVGP